MVFSGIEFLLVFLPIFMIGYALTPARYRYVTLTLGSFVFYAFGEHAYPLVLAVSIVINYGIGLHLRGEGHTGARRILLILAIVMNVGALLLCKSGTRGLVLPLGMSFYTFQILSYLIDVYRGEIACERSPVRLAAYVSMFPKLTSGPIVRYGELAGALEAPRVTMAGLREGFGTFTLGLAAKVLLADRVGILWQEVRVSGVEGISTPLAWLAAVAYSLQLYFDFCGYSLMAVGLGRMLGFALPENFRTPYMARSVRDFYRRWHITLGKWFCRYVYIPLGGSRRGELRTVRNLAVVWTLTGLWHGITLNFLIWGLALGCLIILERLARDFCGRYPRWGRWLRYLKPLGHLYLWTVIPVTWMCFAISNLGELRIYLGRMFAMVPQTYVSAVGWTEKLRTYGGLLAVCLVCCTPAVRSLYRRWRGTLWMRVLLAALFWLCVRMIFREGENPFMYYHY